MARLIDADKRIAETKKLYCDGCDNYDGVRCRACWVDDAMRLIDDATTVDAVEVVRCRDCKWYMPGDLFTDIMFCHRLKKDNGKPAKYNYCADDFCSYAERKEGGGNG